MPFETRAACSSFQKSRADHMTNPGNRHNAAAFSRAARRLQPTGEEIVGTECRERFGLSPTLEYFLLTFLLIGRPISPLNSDLRANLDQRQQVMCRMCASLWLMLAVQKDTCTKSGLVEDVAQVSMRRHFVPVLKITHGVLIRLENSSFHLIRQPLPRTAFSSVLTRFDGL